MPPLESIKQKILAFRNERDWAQFHDPKNLAEALSIEAGELLENFLWKTTEQSRNLSYEELNNVKEAFLISSFKFHHTISIIVFSLMDCLESNDAKPINNII